MNKFLKYIFVLSIILLFVSCQKVEEEKKETNFSDDIIEYPSYTIEEYAKMDNYVYEKTLNNMKFKTTYFFDDDMCVNAKEEVTFSSNELAKKYYDELLDQKDYTNISINGKVVTYYSTLEYFEYMMYPKSLLIDLLNKELDE